MHATHIKKKDFNLNLNSFFEISKSAIFKRKTFSEKFSDLYLMKIQIIFITIKEFRTIFNENID